MAHPGGRIPQVEAIIVSWNARDFLEECLTSLFRETPGLSLEVTVVDNDSSDGTAAMVEARFPRVRLVRNERNLGYAAANNRVLRQILEKGAADYILLLNADAVVRERAVERLVEVLERSPEAAGAAPALVLPGGRFQTGAGGFLPTFRSGASYFLFYSRLFPGKARGLFIHQPHFAKKGREVRLEWLSGACLLLRRQTLESVGLLDEGFFFYLEDIDLGRRIKEKGLGLLYAPQAWITHFHGVTYKTVARRANTEWLAGLFAYVRAERGRTEAALFRAAAAAGFFLRLSGRAAAGLFGRGPGRRERLKEAAAFLIFSLTGRGNRGIKRPEERA